MIALDTLLTYTFAALLLSLSPGPSNLYIMARSINQGHKAGFAAASGMAIGSFIYVIATAIGIAAIFQYSPTAYLVLKLLGAGYLLYLGYLYFKQSSVTELSPAKPVFMSNNRIFKQSIIVELTNPKTALFFIAFLPQFVDKSAGDVTMQLIVLGAIYSFLAFMCDVFVASLSGKLGKWLSVHPSFVYWQDRISGSLLLGLGSYIVYSEISADSR